MTYHLIKFGNITVINMEEKKMPWLTTIKKIASFFFILRNVISTHSSQFLRRNLRECQKLTLIRTMPCENNCHSYPEHRRRPPHTQIFCSVNMKLKWTWFLFFHLPAVCMCFRTCFRNRACWNYSCPPARGWLKSMECNSNTQRPDSRLNIENSRKMQYPFFKSSSTTPNVKNALNSPEGGGKPNHGTPTTILKD